MNDRWIRRVVLGCRRLWWINPIFNRVFLRAGLPVVLSSAVVLVAAETLVADWVTLQSGEHLRGSGFERRGKGFVFTVETGETIYITGDEFRHVEKSPRGEKVEFRGRKVTLAKQIKELQKEYHDLTLATLRRLSRFAHSGANSEDVRAALEKLTPGTRVTSLVFAVRSAEQFATRRLAARELASLNWQPATQSDFTERQRKRASFALTVTAIRDLHPAVRQTARAYVVASHDPNVVEFIAIALRSRSRAERIRAAKLLGDIEDPRGAAALVDTLRLSWKADSAGFRHRTGGVSSHDDYDFVPGATGFSLRELSAIDRAGSATVLEQTRRADGGAQELKARLEALRVLTGQDFGKDVSAWRKWLTDNPIS